MKAVILILAISLSAQLAEADTTRVTSWWLSVKIGSAQSDVSEFQRWAVSQGVSDVTGFSRNTLFGLDILHQRNRMVYGLSSDFELRTFGKTEPYFFAFSFRAGYHWLHSDRFELRSLGGLGIGYTLVRFEGEVPASLQSIAANYTNPYARAGSLIGRMELLASYNLLKQSPKNQIKFKPLLFVNAGFHPVLKHGAWRFGDDEITMDGNQFAGQRIDMPRFYESQWFITAGVAFTVSVANPLN
jgi:hypothetical protein